MRDVILGAVVAVSAGLGIVLGFAWAVDASIDAGLRLVEIYR